MTFDHKRLLISALVLWLGQGSANASIWNLPDSGFPLDEASYSASFTAANSGPASLSFDLQGYLTLDGAGNGYTDTFVLNVNGNNIFSGQYAMGGGGDNVTLYAPAGSNVDTTHTDPWIVNGNGGYVLITTPILLTAGLNTFTFSYGQLQGIGDEGWGVTNAVVTSVPLPASIWLLGSGLLGLVGLRNRTA